MSKSLTQSFYFIDSTLPELDTLLAGLPPYAKVVLLEPDQSGLQQVLTALDGYTNLDAVHVLTHGAPGSIELGNSTLNSESLSEASDALQALGTHLNEDADLLFYGCDVAGNDAGKTLIEQISALTGADVAASDDLTGAAELGGDWELEASVGVIDTTGISAFDFDATLALPGARSVTQGGEVFLGGNYLELGISSTGSFGTVGSKPAGFFGTSQDNRVGMGNDADGFGSGQDLRIDYFMPGSTEERWSIGYNGSQYGGFSKLNGNSGNATSLTDITLTDTSSGDNLSVTFAATISNTLRVEQTHSFGVDDKFFKTTVTLTNITGSTLTDVRYMRSFDPDNTVYQGGSYTTINKIENTYAEDGKAVVSATSMPDSYSDKAGDTAKILYFSSDPRAYVANFGFSNSNPYAAPEQPKGYTTTSDSAIAIVFKGGTLAPGASVTFEKASSLDTADISETVAAIEAASNPAPTFTAFDAPVETSDEDTQVEITFNELAARGNEADQEPIPEDELTEGGPTLREGTVDAFVVTSVKSGTLKIGTDAASATAWNPGTNDVIDATHRAYWTPAPNANNAENASQPIDAFDVKARDSDGLLSSSHVTAQINVTAVNDAPVIASASTNITLAAINEDQALDSINGATVSELVGPRFTDVDAGAQMGGIIIIDDTSTPDQGVWRYTTDGTNWHDIDAVASNSGLALAPTTKLAFFPTANWNGTPGGLVIRVTDEQYVGGYTAGASRVVETDAEASGVSANSINIVTTVNVDNDLPIFTSTEGAASLLETTGWDDAVSVDTGALTGVLSGTDQEDVTENGGSVGFTIRGGTLTGDVVTKSGFYGSLSLDTTTNKWTYTPGNFTAINALAAGATAVDTFEFKVFDSDGGSSIQRLDITLNGTNDLPVLAAVLSDQSFEGGGSFSWQIPADAFTDAEGIDLNYSVETVTDASGETVSGDGSLPAGLSFDEASRTFSGNPNADGTYFIKVTATDSAGAVVSDVFQLDLSNVGNQGPQVAAAVAPQLVLAAQEVTEVVFDAALGGQTLTFGGHTVTLGSAVDAATVASAALAAGNTDNYAVAPKEGTSDTLVFTAAAAGDKLDTSYEDVVTIGSFNGSATVTKVKDGDTAQPESFILTLDDGAGTETSGLAGQTVIFDGTTVTLVDTDASGTVEASEIAEQISGQTFDNWIVAKVDGQNAVRFESTAGDQNLEDILDSDFSGTLKSNGIWETQLTVTDGNDGLEVFEVQYSGGYSGSTLTFDGVTATAGTAVSAADVASTVISASDNFAAHSATAKDGATDTVVFTADTAGESADITAESFTGTYINSGTGTPTVTITTIGRDWAFQLPAGTFVDPEGDALTYEAQLDGSPLSDTAALTFDAATATFSGDGSALPSGVLTVIATDSVSGLSASTSINLSLGNTADTGVTAGTAITDPSWNGDGHFSFQVPADAFAYSEGDTDGNALSYNATLTDGSALPAWLSIDPVTGTLSGNPVHDVPSTLDIKVTATDSNGTESSASQTFTLVLANTNDSPSTTTYLPDVTVNAGESISLDVGDNLFQDPDGHISGDGTAGATDATSGITYSAQVSDGQGGWQALPAW
ncbi:MAG: DUF4347 domain-containing protein, partial [Oceanospirillales bacterium]|nr:DUF4347 domain-containing protein [Oceanospirillales bacterium]